MKGSYLGKGCELWSTWRPASVCVFEV